ncbi:unnamed protein product [Phaedon cochleariae]|uniref:Elongation of very long chain fatty acids protein n=1 Tax=Phaedon cochleariae TaxID=80249 RepID=A0A9N9SET2_PHACE|nr:unnamed protein product [Phaedon cochleariae]
MALVLKRLYLGYDHTFEKLADPRPVELGLILMSSPIWPILIVVAYFYFCLNLGPKLMEHRKPFELKKTIIVFNIAQILINLYIFYESFIELSYTNWSCEPVNYSRSPRFLKLVRLYHLYFLVKLSDFLDTVFFVLRKRYRQVSFLHLYHHFGMFGMTWIAVRFFAGGHGTWLGLFNCPIHAIMYTYYTLSILDEKWKANLAFKKFITQIQMVQFFVMILIYGRLLFLPDCQYSKLCSYFFVPQNFFMLVLFADFYRKAYISKKSTENKKKSS